MIPTLGRKPSESIVWLPKFVRSYCLYFGDGKICASNTKKDLRILLKIAMILTNFFALAATDLHFFALIFSFNENFHEIGFI